MPRRNSKRAPHPVPGVDFNGWHRKVFVRGNSVLKIPQATISRVVGHTSVAFPLWLKSVRRYWRLDMNHAEQAHYQKYFSNIPEKMREYFARVKRVRKFKNTSVLRMEAVRDFDGHVSKTLFETGQVNDLFFWQRFDALVDFLVERRIPFFDFSSLNFVVKRVSPIEAIPVLIDYKSASLRPYALQFWLRLPALRAKRMYNRYQKMKQKHFQSDDA